MDGVDVVATDALPLSVLPPKPKKTPVFFATAEGEPNDTAGVAFFSGVGAAVPPKIDFPGSILKGKVEADPKMLGEDVPNGLLDDV